MTITPEQIRSFCDDFYVNQKLALKMDLPSDRESVLHLFDRVRGDLPHMDRFRRYADELALESGRKDGEYQWLALRRQSVRTGHVNPRTMAQAHQLHKLMLQLAPFYMSISPLDIDYLELMFGFDMECKANQHQVVYEALMRNTPLGALTAIPGSRLLDVQPTIGICLPEEDNLQVLFEIKARTSPGQVKVDRYRTEAISVFLTLRLGGPIKKVDDLPQWQEQLARRLETLAMEKVVPQLLRPIRSTIQGIV